LALSQEVRETYRRLCSAPKSIEVIKNEILPRAGGASLMRGLIRKCGSLRKLSDKIDCDRGTLAKYLRKYGVEYDDIQQKPEKTIQDNELDKNGAEIETERIYELETYADDLELEIESLHNWYAQIGEVINGVVQDYPPQIVTPPQYYIPDTEADEELAFIHTADFHIGELVRPSDTAGLSSYNFEIFQQRRQIFQNAIDKIINGLLRQVFPIKNCIMTCLGDTTTGEDVFPKQMNRIDLPLMQQIFRGAVEIANMILFLSGMFEHLWLYLIPGNHGRTKTTDINTDIILYMFLAAYLRHQPNIDIVISDSDYCGIYIDKTLDFVPFDDDNDRTWNFLFTHGHGARRYMGIPYYGMDRMARRLAQSTGIVWDNIFAGHHHESAETENWTIVGSWVGGTEYSMGRMQAVARPQQLLHGFHPRQGITWKFPIYLGPQPQLTKDDEEIPGLYTPQSDLIKYASKLDTD